MIDFITRSGFITPIEDTPTPLLAVPYAAPRSAHAGCCQRRGVWAAQDGAGGGALAKMSATAAPMKPKKGAEAGQNSAERPGMVAC